MHVRGWQSRLGWRLFGLGCLVALGCRDPVNQTGLGHAADAVSSDPLAVDAFNRPDELPLAGPWVSAPGPWTELQLRSGAVAGVSSGVDGMAYYGTVAWPADQWAEVRLTGLGSPGDGGVALRIAPADGAAYVFVAGGGGRWFGVGKFIGGAYVHFIRADRAFTPGDLLRFEARGDTLRALHNGVVVYERLDAEIPTGHAGIFVYGDDPGLTFDDFAGGGFASTPAPTPPAAPTALSAAAASSSELTLGWTDNAGDETGFRIERCAGAGCGGFSEIAVVGANVTSFRNVGLSASTSYSYRVRAYSAAGTSGYSNVATATTAAPSATDRLPDLGIARLSDIRISRSGSRRRLRYSTTIVNVGTGPFELHGRRNNTGASEMAVAHRIFDDAGGWRDVATPAVTIFSGDGHDHWHVRDLQLSALYRLDDGALLARSDKRGFCFWDNVAHQLSLPGAPPSPEYHESGCGGPNSLSTAMGLSIGWGDIYPSTLPDQYIDVTGLPDGLYRLIVTADAEGWFAESDEDNNATWADIELYDRGRRVRVVSYGPSALIASLP